MLVRKLFIVSTIFSVMLSLGVIGLGIHELILDQKDNLKGGTIAITHLFIAQIIFLVANILILVHVGYITKYVLKGSRYNWHVSVHYLAYIMYELISSYCVMGKYQYYEHPLILHILTAVLAVFLFFFNCWAARIFDVLEDEIREQKEIKEQERKDIHRPGGAGGCVRIPLRDSKFPYPLAGPSKD